MTSLFIDEEATTAKARRAARAKAKAKLDAQGNIINGRQATSTDLWLEELRHIDVRDDSERGEAVLTAASAIQNVKSANIADFLRWLLDSGAWRSYTYPNGDHYEFREREFDYFCAQIDLDPTIANTAARAVDDNELLVAMTEASLVSRGWLAHDVERKPAQGGGARPDRSKRRSVDEITVTYPALRPWLEKYGFSPDGKWAHPLGGPALHGSKSMRAKVAKGASTTQAVGRRTWQACAFGEDDLATRIAEKLIKDGLADGVGRALAAERTRPATPPQHPAAARGSRKAGS